LAIACRLHLSDAAQVDSVVLAVGLCPACAKYGSSRIIAAIVVRMGRIIGIRSPA